MNRIAWLGLGAFSFLLPVLIARADVKPVVEHIDNEHATADFKFKTVPPVSKGGAAAKAKFTIVDGEADPAGGDAEVLHDGKLPTEQDQPAANFFFNAGTEGGRLAIDLGSVIDVKQVNTYSWHPDTRAPQVYTLYAADGKAATFKAGPKKGTDPTTCGWKLIAKIDTRPKEGQPGGQYGVSIADSTGSLGKFRHLLFDVVRTEGDDEFGNTFYSEIDVVDAKGGELIGEPGARPGGAAALEFGDGKYRVTVDTTETPDLTDWAAKELAPVIKEWYPQLVAALPSDGFEAPRQFSITFRKDKAGVADTGGTRINCAADWFRKNLKGEARGAILHEMVHVVQQYGAARRRNPNPAKNPGWLVEGIPDYIRFYLYEPKTHGADISPRRAANAQYDGSYRVSANFLHWVGEKYDAKIVPELNAAMRDGKYSEDLWKKYTGKTVTELGAEWKEAIKSAT